jgi:hypothetical protein
MWLRCCWSCSWRHCWRFLSREKRKVLRWLGYSWERWRGWVDERGAWLLVDDIGVSKGIEVEVAKEGEERWWQIKKHGERLVFYSLSLIFFLSPQYPKSASIYRGWKRNILSFLGTNLDLWFNQEESQSLAQSHHHELLKFSR